MIKLIEEASSVLRNAASSFDMIDLARTWANSEIWVACKDVLSSFYTTDYYINYINTTYCLQPLGSDGWITDPCCNTSLQATMCCAKQLFPMNNTVATLQDFTLFNDTTEECGSINCLKQLLENFNNSSSDRCDQNIQLAVSRPAFSLNPFDLCWARMQKRLCRVRENEQKRNAVCSAVDSDSVCYRSRTTPDTVQCTIPCEPDGTCFLGTCVNISGVGPICRNLSTDQEKIAAGFFACVKSRIDKHLAVLLHAEVEDMPGNDTLGIKFLNSVSTFGCRTENGFAAVPAYTTASSCLAARYCTWGRCEINNVSCTEADCLNSLASDTGGYCALWQVQDRSYVPVSNPGVCNINVTEIDNVPMQRTKSLCLSFKGIWSFPETLYKDVWSICRTTQSQSHCTSECLGIQYKGIPCASYCKDRTRSAPACTGSTPRGNPRAFYAISGSSGVCVVETSYTGCLAEGATWVPGKYWTEPFLNSPASCPATACVDLLGDYDIFPIEECYNSSRCTSCFTGEEDACNSEESCTQKYYCEVIEGCIVSPEINKLWGNNITCQWTPTFCINYGSPKKCPLLGIASLGYQAIEDFTTQEICEAQKICNLGTNSFPRLIDFYSAPPRIKYEFLIGGGIVNVFLS